MNDTKNNEIFRLSLNVFGMYLRLLLEQEQWAPHRNICLGVSILIPIYSVDRVDGVDRVKRDYRVGIIDDVGNLVELVFMMERMMLLDASCLDFYLETYLF